MIYAIAAYSITIGALALYGVILQHRARAHGATRSGESADDPRRGFNVGAALVAPFWLWGHGMQLAGAGLGLLCLALVPLYTQAMWIPMLFVGIVPLAAGAALGVVGNRIAVEHTGLEDAAAFSTSQLPWAVAGIALYTIVLPWAWYFITAPG